MLKLYHWKINKTEKEAYPDKLRIIKRFKCAMEETIKRNKNQFSIGIKRDINNNIVL